MAKSINTKGKTERISVNELLSLIPNELIAQLSADLMVDKWVRKLKAESVFKLVLYSLLNSERLSLRVLENNFKEPMFQAMAPVVASDEVTWTGIRERLIKLKVDFCRKLYEAVYEKGQQLYGVKYLSGYHLKRYDSTLIASFSHLLQGMKVGNTNGGKIQVKLTTELKDDFLIQMHFHQQQAYLSEETALKEAMLDSVHADNDISVFDKGIKSRKTFAQLEQQGILFVGRLLDNPRYDLLHPVWQDNGQSDTEELEFVQDSAVHLYQSSIEVQPTKLRLVQFRLKAKGGQLISFVSNVWDMPAAVIAQIYRQRWDIEVLFRFMKQEMNLSHFVCNDPNAIQVMLYFTMIAAMLILIYKKQNGIQSYKMAKIQFFKELFYSVLIDLLDDPNGREWIRKTAINFIHKE